MPDRYRVICIMEDGSRKAACILTVSSEKAIAHALNRPGVTSAYIPGC